MASRRKLTGRRLILLALVSSLLLGASLLLVYHHETIFSLQNDQPPDRLYNQLQPMQQQQYEHKIANLEDRLAILERHLRETSPPDRDIDSTAMKSDEIKAPSLNVMTKSTASSNWPQVRHLPANERRRILVTGGAGFVGSHLVDRLMRDGHEVTVVDNFHTGRRSNLNQWLGHAHFELLHHDIVNPLFVECDQIYHLASPASPPFYMANPVKTIKTNTVGTINLLGLAKRVHARILIASTSEVYGDPLEHPQNESYWGHVNPIGPRACYDEGKRVAESLAYSYEKQEGVSVRVARIFNTYGPRMLLNDGRVVSNFIRQALEGEPLTIYGSGRQTRSFQFVSDLIEGLVSLMASNYSLPVNLGNPEEYTIAMFASVINNVIRSPRGVIYRNDRLIEDDPQRRRPDISLAKRELSWWPRVSLADGLAATIEYFQREIKESRGDGKKDGNQKFIAPKHIDTAENGNVNLQVTNGLLNGNDRDFR